MAGLSTLAFLAVVCLPIFILAPPPFLKRAFDLAVIGRIPHSARPNFIPSGAGEKFNGLAIQHKVAEITSLGPRTNRAPALQQTRQLLLRSLSEAGWKTRLEEFTDNSPEGDASFANILATHPASGGTPSLLLVARFDAAAVPDNPMAGALDSASGPAVLVALAAELARVPRLAARVDFALLDGSAPLMQYGPPDGLRGARLNAASFSQRDPGRRCGVIVVRGCGGFPPRFTLRPRSSRSLGSLAKIAAADLGISAEFTSLNRPLWDDDLPYLAAGFRTLLLCDADNEIIATADDTAENLNPVMLEQTARLLFQLVIDLR